MNALSLIPRRNDLFAPLQAEFDRFFDEFFNDRRQLTHIKNAGFPKMDVVEEDGKLKMRLAVSGMTKDDLDVECTKDGYVTVRGRMSESYRSGEDAKVYVRELRASAFERSLRLPEHVVTDADPVAKLEDGILTLEWPTEIEAKEDAVKKIEIQSGPP